MEIQVQMRSTEDLGMRVRDSELHETNTKEREEAASLCVNQDQDPGQLERKPLTQSGYKDSWALASLWKADVILLRVHQLAPQECCG